jgi:isopropylmalate/homocitrate/citramalate synthase
MNMNTTSRLPAFKGIIDSTLREGLQFSRAAFSLAQMKDIYLSLARIGVDFVEVGNPAQPAVREMISALVRTRRPTGPRILSHIRNHPEDVARAVEAGVHGVNILCTVDAERLSAMDQTPEGYADRLRANIRTARSRGLLVRVGVEDFFGQAPAGRLDLHAAAVEEGVDRIAVADTLGKTMEWEVFRRVRALRRRFPTDIEVHFHNDLGHAVSNAIVALRAGANWISTSLLGIGERTGITPLSSILANLLVLDEEAAERYRTRWLTPAESAVARLCGMDMPPHLVTNPVNGFAHKAGIHLDALIKFGPRKYECLRPEAFGNKRRMIIDTPISGKTTSADIRSFEKRFGGGPS